MTVLARFSKALFALPVPLLGLLVAFGVDLTPDQQEAVLAVVTVLTPLAVVAAPANAPAVPTPGPDVPTATDEGKPMQEPEPFVGDPERLPNA